MSIEEWPQGQLVIRDPLEYAKRLFAKKEYIGGFTVLHALIEFWMQDLYELHCIRSLGPLKTYQLHIAKIPYRYRKLVSDLMKAELIDDNEARRITDFGLLRDRIVHRLVKYSYQTHDWHVVKKDEVVRGFDEGLGLVELLSARCNHSVSITIVLRPTKRPPKDKK